LYALDQQSDYAGDVRANPYLGKDTPIPVIQAGIDLTTIRNNAGGFAWEIGQAPAHTMTQTVYDSLGNPREISILLYQVNDLGDVYNSSGGVFGNNPNGPSQVAYAWYAFETTGGVAPATNNLLGGTAVIEGDYGTGQPNIMGFDRGINPGVRAQFCGDLLYFNTDGSLASEGGVYIGGTGNIGALSMQADARLYLPALNYFPPPAGPGGAPVSPLPVIGAEQMMVTLDFGTGGGLTQGLRDGLYSDAAGSFQVVNGVNTYIPNHTAFIKSQDGYSEGQLKGINFDASGILKGTFGTTAGDQIIDLGQLVLARVSNPEGLNKTGNSYYSASNNSGPIFIGLAGDNGLGSVQGYSLEGSNVDLTTELSNLIIAQRGFEVNARTITTTNETLQTLVNLGR
jgi:flagellar hook-basal body protein